MTLNNGFLQKSRPSTGNSATNAIIFLVSQMLAQINVATLVEVVEVYGGGGLDPVGTVDVRPLVQQTDNDGIVIPSPVLYGLPYFRLQGGTNAVIVDPKPGDVGFCVFADSDISLVKDANGGANPPGSQRTFSPSDGLYIGGWLPAVTPVSYVQVTDDEIKVVSPTAVTVTSPSITLDGAVHITGAVTGDSTASFTEDVTGEGTSLHTHKHGGVTSGGAQTGVPV